MTNTTIKYAGMNPMIGANGQGLGPTPFVTRSENFLQVGERLVTQETLTLRGVLTGQCEYNAGHTNRPYSQFTAMVSGGDYASPQIQLIKNFGSDFQDFEIFDNGSGVFSRDLVQVTNINFPDNNYGAIHPYLPFEVTLQTYPTIVGGRLFDDGTPWNVLQPTHELIYESQEDATIAISETLSAQGLNTIATGNNALANAVKWVEAYDCAVHGLPSLPDAPTTTACLRTVSETINRFAGTYEKRNTYVYDSVSPGSVGILRYTVTYSYSEDEGISTIEINGTIEGCRTDGSGIAGLRARYNQFQPFQTAISTKIQMTGNPNLNPNATNKSVTEDTAQLRISFTFTFNDDMRPDPSFDYRCVFNYDFENDVITASIDGDCTTRQYNLNHAPGDFPVDPDLDGTGKWQKLSQFADNVSLLGKLQTDYAAYLTSLGLQYSDYPLNPYYTSFSRTNNFLDWKISLNASYRSQPAILPAGFRKAEVTINITPPLKQYKEFPCLDGKGKYTVYDLRYATRGSCSIQFNGTTLPETNSDDALNTAKTTVQSLQSSNFTGARISMDAQQYIKNTTASGRTVTASANYSAEQTPAFSLV